MSESSDASEEVAALVARGDYLGAAQRAAAQGDPARAIALYERVWRFADAAPLAVALGDRPLAVRLWLDAADAGQAAAVAAAIPADARDELLAAARAFASRGRLVEAAALAERAGDLRGAAALHQRAGALLDAARALELAGDAHGAGVILESLIEQAGPGGDAGDEAPRARLGLGRLLGRLGRHEDAARTLQAAARSPSVAVAARRALCVELLALGHRGAAAEVVRRLRRELPALPATPEEVAAEEAAHEGAGAAAADPSLLRRRFRVRGLIGSGATGRVYAADDVLVGRPVAVKLLSVGAGASGPEGQAYARFRREADATARIRHPNIVQLFDIDPSAGLLVLELLPEGTLFDALSRQGALAPTAVRRLGLDLLAALGATHERGIVHRDVKPANVFFDAAGNAKLGDFGVAHLLDFGQTQTGGFFGTVGYMAPEQITGAGIGPRADLYALAVTLFEALTGRRPFLGPDVVGQHLAEEPPAPSVVRPGLSPAHDEVILRAMAKDPEARYATGAEMAAAVRAWPTDLRPPAPPALPAAPLEDAAAAPQPGGDDLGLEIGRTTAGRLFVRHDPRVGRTVFVEQHEHPLDDAAAARLRALAAAGGPSVQRVLALSDDRLTVTYEALEGEAVRIGDLPARDTAAVEQAFAALEAAGVPRAEWPRRAVRTPGGPVLVIAAP